MVSELDLDAIRAMGATAEEVAALQDRLEAIAKDPEELAVMQDSGEARNAAEFGIEVWPRLQRGVSRIGMLIVDDCESGQRVFHSFIPRSETADIGEADVAKKRVRRDRMDKEDDGVRKKENQSRYKDHGSYRGT